MVAIWKYGQASGENMYKMSHTQEEDPTQQYLHSPSASMLVSKLLMGDTARQKARIFQLDGIGAFLQTSMESRVFIIIPNMYGAPSPSSYIAVERKFY
jgi:hypothetical protein